MSRLIGTPAVRLVDHLRVHGPVTLDAAHNLPSMARQAGLRGRGGAGFPIWRKFQAVATAADAPGSRPVVVANAAEGEPLSAKDRMLLLTCPHLVLDGLELAASALGSTETHMVLHPDLATGMQVAVAERGSGTRVHGAPRRFVAGQESAVVAIVEGRSALPGPARARVSERGVRGRPTLVSNVETLAHLAVLARCGVAAYRSVGTTEQPGTSLVTTSGADGRLFVSEVAYGTAMSQVLGAAFPGPQGYVLIGGYHGTWVRAGALIERSYTDVDLEPLGARAGSILHGIGSAGFAERVGEILSYLAAQSASQCGPCVNGLPALHDAWQRWSAGDPTAAAHLDVLAEILPGRGACAHPDGVVRMALSAYRLLREDRRLDERTTTALVGSGESA